jgi:ABC-type amino acid transport substrate-binding protein
MAHSLVCLLIIITQYEVELFRHVAIILGWEPDMLEWTCMNNWEELIEHLKANDGVCDIAPTGINIDPTRLKDGINYTRPTYRSAGASACLCFQSTLI